MKRAFLRKVKPISCPGTAGTLVGQPEQAPIGAKRRARTSAAMVGLALSMGASSLLLPRQSDGAAAAEPVTNETATSVARADLPPAETALNLSAVISAAQTGEHVVREGETLRQIARRYDISVEKLAAANQIAPTALLRVGQVLRLPAPEAATAASTEAKELASRMPRFVASANLNQLPMASPTDAVDPLRVERDEALNRLRQERSKLSSSLAELRNEETSVRIAEAPKLPVAGTATEKIAAETESTPHLITELPQRTRTELQPAQTTPASERVSAAAPPTEVAVNPALSPEPSPVTSQPNVVDSSAATSSTVYRVNRGDTVAEIARAHNIPQSVLISTNRLSNPNIIFVGQELRVPAVSPTTVEIPVAVASASPVVPALAAPVASESSAAASTNSLPGVAAPTVVTSPSRPDPDSVVPASAASSLLDPSPQPTAPEAVAVVPSTLSPTPDATAPDLPVDLPETDLGYNPYVQTLLAEVRALRAKQATAGTSAQPPVLAAAAIPAPTAVELRNERLVEPEAESAATVRPRALRTLTRETAPATESSEPLTVAAAPLGSESYAPLVQPITGRMVSPELPPLQEADIFLPNSVFRGYIWPARGVLTSGYGWRWGRMHRGIDIAADVGTPIYAAADGVVEFAGWNSGGYGNMVEIRHPDGSMTRYAHNNRVTVQVGQRVRQGELIAEMGSTGYSTGPHLHFEVHLPDSGTVNPISYLPAR
ncbi:MAG: peptidoglycan DD-metalloendopeptidase family protein [Synechococcales cyanobacterium C42_A2020_086]|nr:peptidoglycan DD-metalloendopeptidase family protein [Synechococcales cyanobacterium C42_A2020_086]